MNKFTGFFATVLISFTLILSGISDVEAKRFGGGGSFGGKSSFGKPFRRSSTAKPTRSASKQKAYQQNQTARQGLSRRGGFMGLLGGLALGGLLGSMFFGGAFEGFNFMDILLFGGLAYLILRIFSAKSSARQQTVYSNGTYNYDQTDSLANSSSSKQQSYEASSQENSAGFDTDILVGKNKQQTAFNESEEQTDANFEQNIMPVGFDQAGFLAGAKGAFKELQKAWDERDLATIRGLSSDKVFAEIQDQLSASNEQNQTDILKLDAELLSIREIGNDFEAVVLFDSIIREDAKEQAEQVREVWHFIKSKNSIQPKWTLDGIQQLEQ